MREDDFMVTNYHKRIENAIVAFGKDTKQVKKVLRGNEHPLSLVDSFSKRVVNYKPDAYFLLKNRGKLIFQVLESELKKQDTLIADVVRACLVENCDGIIFIHPSGNKEDENRVLEALNIVIRGLNKKGLGEDLPKTNGCYRINRKDAKNKKTVVSLLTKLSKEDNWFKFK